MKHRYDSLSPLSFVLFPLCVKALISFLEQRISSAGTGCGSCKHAGLGRLSQAIHIPDWMALEKQGKSKDRTISQWGRTCAKSVTGT